MDIYVQSGLWPSCGPEGFIAQAQPDLAALQRALIVGFDHLCDISSGFYLYHSSPVNTIACHTLVNKGDSNKSEREILNPHFYSLVILHAPFLARSILNNPYYVFSLVAVLSSPQLPTPLVSS